MAGEGWRYLLNTRELVRRLRNYERLWYEVGEGIAERSIPEEIHRLLTRCINHYVVRVRDGHLKELLAYIRDRLASCEEGAAPLMNLWLAYVYALNRRPELVPVLDEMVACLLSHAESEVIKELLNAMRDKPATVYIEGFPREVYVYTLTPYGSIDKFALSIYGADRVLLPLGMPAALYIKHEEGSVFARGIVTGDVKIRLEPGKRRTFLTDVKALLDLALMGVEGEVLSYAVEFARDVAVVKIEGVEHRFVFAIDPCTGSLVYSTKYLSTRKLEEIARESLPEDLSIVERAWRGSEVVFKASNPAGDRVAYLVLSGEDGSIKEREELEARGLLGKLSFKSKVREADRRYFGEQRP